MLARVLVAIGLLIASVILGGAAPPDPTAASDDPNARAEANLRAEERSRSIAAGPVRAISFANTTSRDLVVELEDVATPAGVSATPASASALEVPRGGVVELFTLRRAPGAEPHGLVVAIVAMRYKGYELGGPRSRQIYAFNAMSPFETITVSDEDTRRVVDLYLIENATDAPITFAGASLREPVEGYSVRALSPDPLGRRIAPGRRAPGFVVERDEGVEARELSLAYFLRDRDDRDAVAGFVAPPWRGDRVTLLTIGPEHLPGLASARSRAAERRSALKADTDRRLAVSRERRDAAERRERAARERSDEAESFLTALLLIGLLANLGNPTLSGAGGADGACPNCGGSGYVREYNATTHEGYDRPCGACGTSGRR